MKKIIIEFKNKFYYVCLLIISLLVYWRWLNFNIQVNGDFGYFYSQYLKEFLYFPIWISSGNFGNTDVTFWRSIIINLPIGILGYFNFDYNFVSKIVVLWPYIILGPISSYFFVYTVVKNKLASFVGALIFSFNTYFFAINTQGHILLALASHISLFSLVFYFHFFKSNKLKYLILSTMFLFITASLDLRIAYFCLFIILSLNIFQIWKVKIHIFQLVPILLKILIFYLLFILLSLFWILPLIYTGNALSNNTLERPLFGNSYWNITSAIALHHPFWTGQQLTWFVRVDPPIYLWLIPFFTILGLIFNRRNKIVILFGLFTVIGILLSKQVDQPLPQIYPWLFSHFPGFNAFRESTKFYYFIIMGYSIIISFFLKKLQFIKFSFNKYIFYSCIILITIPIIYNIKPLITGEIKTMFYDRNIPDDYIYLNKIIKSDNTFYRILWIPLDPPWVIFSQQNPKLNITNLISNEWMHYLDPNKQSDIWPYYDKMTDVFLKKYSNFLLDISSIKYVAVPSMDLENNYNLFSYFGKNQEYYVSILNNLPYLTKIYEKKNGLIIYENNRYNQPFFSFTNLLNLNNLDLLDQKYIFTIDILKSQFYFVNNSTNSKLTKLINIFDDITINDIKEKSIFSHQIPAGNYNIFNYAIHSGKLDISNGNFVKNILPNKIIGRQNINLNNLYIDSNTKFVYTNNKVLNINLINNPSFKEGPWTERVYDCHDFDNNPEINMQVVNNNSSSYLELGAQRHIACTKSSTISVLPSSDYLFSFKYRSSNSDSAGYYIEFNSDKDLSINRKIQIKDFTWHTYNEVIHTPKNANNLSIMIYSYPDYSKNNLIVTQYTDFHLIQIPSITNSFYLVNNNRKLINPRKISYKIISPTKKLVRINGAYTSFYLGMSEGYHPQWKLELNNYNTINALNSWIPYSKTDKIPDSDHFKLNDFLNAWYVDLDTFCKKEQKCVRNKDGSYDMEMVIEFWPQRWFYVGVVISGITFAACIIYLLKTWMVKKRRVYD